MQLHRTTDRIDAVRDGRPNQPLVQHALLPLVVLKTRNLRTHMCETQDAAALYDQRCKGKQEKGAQAII
jgi:hypothetical protein